MYQSIKRKQRARPVGDRRTSKAGGSTLSTKEKNARNSLVELVRHVLKQKDGFIIGLPYGEFALRIGQKNKRGRGNARIAGRVLIEMGKLLKGLEGEGYEPVPYIQSLVVRKTGKDKGLPSNGIKVVWPDYPKMSRSGKRRFVEIEYEKILSFGSRWNDVLRSLGLRSIGPTSRAPEQEMRTGSSGESPQHKLLKNFVRKNPGIVGATRNWESFEEYPLPSLDLVDVVFISSRTCIAVEVKSKVSNQFPSDYERGIYQAIKYGAILRAMSKAGNQNIPAIVESVLLLESKLPSDYRKLAEKLGLTVYENVKPSTPVNRKR